ncbi:MAG TPA: hypothetical protein VIJ26_08785, partial [Thermoanaerobaculia bacterium]
TRTVRPFAPRGPGGPAELPVLRPAEGAVIDPARDVAEVAVRPGAHARFRLLIVTRINGAVFDLEPGAVQGAVQGTIVQARFPIEMLQTSERLYGKGEHYWWIEARDAAGRVSGFSRMRSFRLAD